MAWRAVSWIGGLAAFLAISAGRLNGAMETRPEAEGEVVLMRDHPTQVRWGEIAVVETDRLRIAPRGDETEYPHGYGLTFSGHRFVEDIEKLRAGLGRPRAEVAVAGSIFIASNMDENGWERFKEKLMAAAAEVGSSSYGPFIGEFGPRLKDQTSDASGDFSLVYCASTAAGEDRSGEVHRRSKYGPDGEHLVQEGSDNPRDPRPACSALRRALGDAPATEVATTELVVQENVRETLRVQVESQMDEPAAAWPARARLERKPPPEGAESFEHTRHKGNISTYEALRLGRGEEGAYLLHADTAPASLPPDLARSRSVLMRWSWTAATESLGAEPRQLGEERSELLYGVFLESEGAPPALEPLRSAMAKSLEKTGGLLTASAVRAALVESAAALHLDEHLALICHADGGDFKAAYCLARSCSPVTNAPEICAAIRARLAS